MPHVYRFQTHKACQCPPTCFILFHFLKCSFVFVFLFIYLVFLELRLTFSFLNGLHKLSLIHFLSFFFFPRYGTLLELGEKRKDMLEKSCKKFMLFREANELQQWIHEKESTLTNEEMGSDLEQVEVLQKKFDDFQKVISVVFCFVF